MHSMEQRDNQDGGPHVCINKERNS